MIQNNEARERPIDTSFFNKMSLYILMGFDTKKMHLDTKVFFKI